MGMAASQARLLSLTARLHDVELKAQNIMSQKIALATQKDELYQEYCDALDATAIKVAFMDCFGDKNYVDANYQNLCTYMPERMKQYAIKDNRTGNLIVSEKTKEMFESFGQDKYAFAYAMLGFNESFNWEDDYGSTSLTGNEVGKIGYAGDDDTALGYIEEADGTNSLYMTTCEQIVFENHPEDEVLNSLYDAIGTAEDKKTKQKALDDFRAKLYEKYDSEIFEQMNYDKAGLQGEDFDLLYPDMVWEDIEEEFNYFVTLWSAINEAGGCQVIDPRFESGEEGNTWFKNMVESGLVTIQVWDDTGKKGWSDTSVTTSTNNNFLQEVQDDKDLKKAEAKYEHELEIISNKDSKFDTELNKLETERKSLTTEMESIKKVKDDNIDRTFGIFS